MSVLAHFADSSRTSPEVREVPIGDIATFAISGKGLAYSYPSPMDHTPRRDWNETSPPNNFCIWPRALPRSRP